MNKDIEMLEHTSEVKFKIRGMSLEKIFENSALAFSNFVSRGEKIKPLKKVKIKIEGEDSESLLYNFIDELIYLSDAKGFIVSKAKVKLRDNKLEAELQGDKTSNYPYLDHVKAPTYSEMYVKKNKDSWEAVFVLDV